MLINEMTRRLLMEQLARAKVAQHKATRIVVAPGERDVQTLEDTLNELQDAGYQARSLLSTVRRQQPPIT